MNQIDRILDKAEKLNLNAGDNLESIAKAVGFKTFDNTKDLNKLETKLDNLIYENKSPINNDIESIDQDNVNGDYLNEQNDDEIESLDDNPNKESLDDNPNDLNNPNKESYDNNPNNLNNPNKESSDNNPSDSNNKNKESSDNNPNDSNNKNKESSNNNPNKESSDINSNKNLGNNNKFQNANEMKKNNNPNNNPNNGINRFRLHKSKSNSENNQNNDKSGKQNAKENVIDKLKNSKNKVNNIKGKAAGKGKNLKLIISFIKKNPTILLIIVGLIIIFLIIIIIMSTGDYSGNNPIFTCDTIPMKSTTLTKDEFIEKVTASLSSSANPGAAIFIENAGLIYDKSLENSVNPEIVIIRSRREGFSPSGSRKALADNPNLASYNNYYGMGCNNTGGLANCTNYEDFEEGLLDFLAFVKQYSNINDMMAKYSSLGSYWYNTEDNSKNTGLGGCYYLEYIKPYLPEDRISVAESACREGNYCYRDGSGNCVETTEEDRKAYTQYQVQEMSKDRTAIFGLEPEVCYNFAEGCVIYGQNDPKWADKYLGHSNADMGHYGCAVTSIAIGIRCSGVEVTIPDFDAGTFLDALNEGNCFDASGGIASWDCPAINEVAPSVKYLTQESGLLSKSDEEVIALINQYDPNTTFIVLHFNHEDRDGGHFIVYSGINGEYFLVKDPAQGGIQNNIKISKIDRFIVYSTNYGV